MAAAAAAAGAERYSVTASRWWDTGVRLAERGCFSLSPVFRSSLAALTQNKTV